MTLPFKLLNLVVPTAIVLLFACFAAAQNDDPLFDVQVTQAEMQEGQYVLCPSRQFYDKAIQNGVDKTIFIYYTARFVSSDERNTKVKSLSGSEYSLPNQMVIPIPTSQTAQVGDIVLTWWQSGSGMQRAIVVGGTETEPIVRYLDVAYDNPINIGKKDEQLKPDSFVVLSKDLQIGTSVKINENGHGILLAKNEDKVIVMEFGGKLKSYDLAQVGMVPWSPAVDEGAAKGVVFGRFKDIQITRVDKEIGRIFATHVFAGKEKEEVLPFGSVIEIE